MDCASCVHNHHLSRAPGRLYTSCYGSMRSEHRIGPLNKSSSVVPAIPRLVSRHTAGDPLCETEQEILSVIVETWRERLADISRFRPTSYRSARRTGRRSGAAEARS